MIIEKSPNMNNAIVIEENNKEGKNKIMTWEVNNTINKDQLVTIEASKADTIQTRNAYNDSVQYLGSGQIVNKDEKSIFESNSQKINSMEENSEKGNVIKIIPDPYSNREETKKVKVADQENASMNSSRVNNSIEKGTISSLQGKLESFRDSNRSLSTTLPDWKYSGLYRFFTLLYQENSIGWPRIEEGKIYLTKTYKPLSEFVFEKYYENPLPTPLEKSDILKDSQASIALKYIKQGLKRELNKTLPGEETSSEGGYLNESQQDFNYNWQKKYFQIGMDTLKYLMSLLSLHK